VEYAVLQDLDSVLDIAEEWDALLERSPCNRAFSSSAWFSGVCRSDPRVSPHVVTARRNGELAGVLPLLLNADGSQAAFATRLNDYNDLITTSGDASLLAEGLLAHCDAQAWDRLVLRRIRQDFNCFRALRSAGRTDDIEKYFQKESSCPFIRLPKTYDEYLTSRTKKFRKRLRSVCNRARRDGLEVRQLLPESFPPDRLPKLFLSLHFSRFGDRSNLHDPLNQTFCQLVFPQLYATGKLLALALWQRETIVGVVLSMRGANSLCIWNGGFLPELANCSPGSLLDDAVVRHAIAAGVDELDFLRGAQPYKLAMANDLRTLGRFDFTNSNGKLTPLPVLEATPPQ
jgi:CelD/BcsL family acetyltransferase involved in cellulose biosynthesis